MDKKLFIETISEIGAAPGAGYSGVYAGNSFCAHGLPAPELAVEMALAAREASLSFHFATPPLNETALSKARAIAEALREKSPGAEIIANDIGFLSIIKKEYPELVPVAGRILAAQRTDPVVPDIIDSEFSGEAREKKHAEMGHVSVNNKAFGNLLLSMGVTRLEIQNPMQGAAPSNRDFKYSLHTPYVCVSSTGTCAPVETYTRKGRIPGLCRCDKHCETKYFRLQSGASRQLIFRGNAVFYENRETPAPTGIDRIVEHKLPG